MAAIRLNPGTTFYAHPEEIATWIFDWKKKHEIRWQFGRRSPQFEVTDSVDGDNLTSVLEAVIQYEELFFRLEPFDTSVISLTQIHYKNSELFDILLPKFCDNELSFSNFGSLSKQLDSIRIWKSIARDVYARTEAGVWYSSALGGKPVCEKKIRYTDGAAKLWRSGTKLIGGGEMFVVRLKDD